VRDEKINLELLHNILEASMHNLDHGEID